MRAHGAIPAAALLGVALAGLVAAGGCITSPDEPAEVLPEPPPSAGHALVYHDALQAVVLVNAGLGGASSPPVSAPTTLWQWSGARWTVLDAAGPPVRNLAGVAYDRDRETLVMQGGSYDLDHVYDETWEWSAARGWRRVATGGPGPRDHTQMTYDPIARATILFGGQIGLTQFPADTWGWDGQAWKRLASSGPGARVHHTMAWDARAQRVTMFGGEAPGAGARGDTWGWSAGSWQRVAADIPPRTHATIAAGPKSLLLLGGFPPERSGQVLALAGASWIASPDGPGPRYLTAMAFDARRQVTVLFGGGDPASDALYADTWEYDGVRWRKVR